ncbi:MAG TPA: polysaccharide ABC transporter ATP-binding protein [Vicinamibacterales bacterium]|nr:polysaccharide ABC transporter ATP-binding protein [Vicinamibacterales bacterium]
MTPAIRAVDLSKRYRLGVREPYGAMRDLVSRSLRAPVRALRRVWAGETDAAVESVWALDRVSFEVGEGSVVGIIGRNGSGKSTLLKILSRITEPTSGLAEVRGRVGSLLEVGTGFHPELSGRENVFVNGAILGMKRREIARKFDEIVAFADVARFIDTPVKHYSSGMQMRLAFAVAAHLEPSILLVDEVLAVGDAEFQRRCLGKMQDVSREGRTVLLVSHQMGQIRRLCDTVMWLDKGRVRHLGEAATTIKEYETATMRRDESLGFGQCFNGWELERGGHTITDGNRAFTLRIDATLAHPVANGHFGVSVLDSDDAVVVGWAFEPVALGAGRHALDVTVPQLPIRPGTYRLSFALFNQGNNLTGGRLVEKWTAVPALLVDTPPVAHPQDEWAGILNVPATLSSPGEAPKARRDVSRGHHVADKVGAGR